MPTTRLAICSKSRRRNSRDAAAAPVLRGGKRSGAKNVPVTLATRSTEIGTLELYCVAKEGDNRWRLEFNVRDVLKDEDEVKSENVVTDVWPEELVQAAAARIRAAYENVSGPDPKQLTKELEAALDANRDKWPTGLCRRLWDFLAEVADRRRLSPAHLSRWHNLVGFCLRPGFGDPMDKFRVEQLWKSIHSAGGKGAKPGLAQPEGGADFWIMWRRVAGGLGTPLQNTLFSRLRPILLPRKAKSAKPAVNEYTEMWRAADSLERLDLKTKEQLGEARSRQCRRSPTPPYAFSPSRLGARSAVWTA